MGAVEADDGFNLVASSDEWMSPVFAEVGPDGAVWFSDWQNYIIQHNPTPSLERGGYVAKTGVGGAHENELRDHSRGRVYRVVWNQAKAPAIKSLKGASDAQLVAALGSDTQFWRLTAQRLIVDGKRSGTVPALRTAVAGTNAEQAIHALWSLQGLGQLDEATHRTALLHKDANVRRNAVRALGSDPQSVALFFSSAVVSDADATTKLAALVKLAEFPTSPQIQTVATSIVRNPANQKDEWLREAVRILARVHGAQLYREGPNLLPNPGLEEIAANGLPQGWTRRDYGNREANKDAAWSVVAQPAHGGTHALRVSTRGDADTSLYVDVPLKPNTQYRLSGWIKTTGGFSGRASLNVHGAKVENEIIRRRDTDWTQVETEFNSGDRTTASVNLLHVARGETFIDDVKLIELSLIDDTAKATAGDAARVERLRGTPVVRGYPTAVRSGDLIWFVSSTGVAALDPRQLRDTPPPVPRIEQVLVDGRPADTASAALPDSSSFMISSKTRALGTFCKRSASVRIGLRARGSISKPQAAAKRTARTMRIGSSR